MKWLMFVVVVIVFVQSCSSASVVKRSTDSYKWSDVQIDNFRKELKLFPGMDSQAVDDFSKVLNNFRQNSTDHDMFEGILKLLSITVNVDFSKMNQTIYEQMHNATEVNKSSSGEDMSSSREDVGFLAKNLTNVQLNDLESSFSKYLSPFQTKRAMDIIRGFCEDASSKETDATVVRLFTSAMQVALHMPNKGNVQSTENSNRLIPE